MREPETQAEFGRRHGVSRQAVHKHIAAGNIPTLPDGRIDPDAADAAAAKHLKRHRKLGPSAAESHIARARQDSPTHQTANKPPADDDSATAFYLAKVTEQKYRALREKLEYEIRAETLVLRSDVELAAENAARQLRDQLLGMATQLAPDLALLADPLACERAVRAALRPILDNFSAYAFDLGGPKAAAE